MMQYVKSYIATGEMFWYMQKKIVFSTNARYFSAIAQEDLSLSAFAEKVTFNAAEVTQDRRNNLNVFRMIFILCN